MLHTKGSIFNLALGALLLKTRIVEPSTDTSNNNKVLLDLWPVAYASTLTDMDLTSTMQQATLALITQNPNALWSYAYKYPSNCLFLRRIQTVLVKDNETYHEPKQVVMHGTQKAIYANKEDAIAEFIAGDLPVSSLGANAGLAIAYRLAVMAAPLVVGKGARKLREDNQILYMIEKAEAQETDRLENFSYSADWIESGFVEARMS